MKKKPLLVIFIIILAAELTGIQLNNEIIQFIFKPLLMIVVGGYFFLQTGKINDVLKRFIVAALFFSWLGDILLMFQAKKEIFFLLGLSAFLLAHVSYIIFFHGVRVRDNIKSNILLLLIVVIYYAILITILSPHLGDMKLPVRIYGIVISFMFMLAMHMLFMKNKIAGRWMMTGALLFVISDSVLAINKFYQPLETAGIIIMLSYALAQLFIIEGASRYITSDYKE